MLLVSIKSSVGPNRLGVLFVRPTLCPAGGTTVSSSIWNKSLNSCEAGFLHLNHVLFYKGLAHCVKQKVKRGLTFMTHCVILYL